MNFSKNFRRKFFSKEIIVSIAIAVSAFILDRISKIIIIKYQAENKIFFFVNDYLNIDLVWNTGIGFGLLSLEATIFYHAISLLIFLDKVLYSLILGGALGNFYDRLSYFAVPDFIDIHINDFHWFTFNIADIFITIGIILLISKDLILIKK